MCCLLTPCSVIVFSAWFLSAWSRAFYRPICASMKSSTDTPPVSLIVVRHANGQNLSPDVVLLFLRGRELLAAFVRPSSNWRFFHLSFQFSASASVCFSGSASRIYAVIPTSLLFFSMLLIAFSATSVGISLASVSLSLFPAVKESCQLFCRTPAHAQRRRIHVRCSLASGGGPACFYILAQNVSRKKTFQETSSSPDAVSHSVFVFRTLCFIVFFVPLTVS